MFHTIFGFAALLLTLTILLRTWEAPRWAIRAFCVCALVGAVVFALSRPGPVGPVDGGSVPPRRTVLTPVVEGIWDAREPRLISSNR